MKKKLELEILELESKIAPASGSFGSEECGKVNCVYLRTNLPLEVQLTGAEC